LAQAFWAQNSGTVLKVFNTMKGLVMQELSTAKKMQSPRLLPGSTMLVVRNIPCMETIDHIQKLWPDKLGWNYLYLPFSISKNRSMGYAFINFTHHERAVEFAHSWHQRALPGHARHRALSVSMATVQSVGESLASLKWELLLQLADIGMEPVLLVQGQRVDTRFAYLAACRPPPGLTNEPINTKGDVASSWVRTACFSGLTSELVKKPVQTELIEECSTSAESEDDCSSSGVSESEMPWPLHLTVLSL